MSVLRPGCICVAMTGIALLGQPAFLAAETTAKPAHATAAKRAEALDGQHDFDWMFGTWKADLKRLVRPLTGSTSWVEFEGTQITRKVWDGRATLDEFVVNSPETNTAIEGVALRLYNPESHEWTIYWANAKRGLIEPPVTGRFKEGRGEFYGMDTFEGRAILVRYIWSDITATSAHFEQAFSVDGGKTWETNWISNICRMNESTSEQRANAIEHEGRHLQWIPRFSVSM